MVALHIAGVVAACVGSLAFGSGDHLHAYNYSDILKQYCHEALDWGPLPRKPKLATELLQVQVFIRHGARTLCDASFCWDGDQEGSFTCGLNDLESAALESGPGTASPRTPLFRKEYLPERNALRGNCRTGQLVKSGLDMHQRNGKRLRAAYMEAAVRLLSPTLAGSPADLDKALFLRSTDMQRTRASARALVMGLLYADSEAPPAGAPVLSLKTMDFSQENMLVNPRVCAAVEARQAEYYEQLPAQEAQELQSLCQDLRPAAAPPLDSNNKCVLYLSHVIDCIMSRMCPTVPFEPRDAVPDKFLEDENALLRRIWAIVDRVQWGFFLAMTSAGAMSSFIGEILHAAQKAVEDAEGPKFLLYSGHDSSLEPLWAALELRKEPPYWPPFAAMTILEIWNSSSPVGPLIRWLSNGAVIEPPEPWFSYKKRLEVLASGTDKCGV